MHFVESTYECDGCGRDETLHTSFEKQDLFRGPDRWVRVGQGRQAKHYCNACARERGLIKRG